LSLVAYTSRLWGAVETTAARYDVASLCITAVNEALSCRGPRIGQQLTAGTYYLQVEGYDDFMSGRFSVSVSKLP
jgi:predicted secreted Zn-dependent protease